ncbi:MAG TPA: hypothetical protein VJP02_16505 [Candidatus Sulfotelmatobacter sp.]|nr:hypothetical protein [Candidatus Sulfotelmatobacter sp.]
MDRRENNKQALDSIRDNDGNKQHIFARLLRRFNLKRKLAVMLKHDRQERDKAQANIEIYLDDWAFHRGGLTKNNVKEALADCVDRVVKLHQTKQQRTEDAAFREMQGPLGEFADEGTMGDLPGDADFERYVLKQHPELKKK